jgi:predicted acylesterase/phospholipase RssA
MKMMHKFENIGFGGAGVRGVAWPGVLKAIQERNIVCVKRMIGASAGAITALAFCLGYECDQISSISIDTRFDDLLDKSGSIINDIKLITNFGLFTSENLCQKIKTMIKHRTFNGEMTFAELRAWQSSLAEMLPALYVVVTNVTRRCRVVLSHEVSPCFQVAEACPGYGYRVNIQVKKFIKEAT